MIRSYLFLSLFVLFCQLCLGQPDSRQVKIISDLQKELTNDLKKDNLHGSLSAAIVEKGKVIWAGACGYASYDKDIPADTGTIYRICSITKMFTVTLLMQLVEEGKVKLDDLAETYVPEIKLLPGYDKQTRFTLQQLASHTSGLDREPQGIPDLSFGPVDKWEEKVLALIPHVSFHSSPGEQFSYSNVGFALLGLALERAADKPYVQLVQERIFTPLNMNNSFFAVPGDKRDRLAPGIEYRTGIINTQTPLRQIDGMGYRVPNGGIWSTPVDLARFEIAFMNGTLIKAASIRKMLEIPSGSRSYGMGMMIMRDNSLTMIGHDGSDPGYTSQFSIDPKTGNAVILLRNCRPGATDLISTTRDVLRRL
ncbi:MAG: beta-lactamase family protein [Chitinophagaceae bacterium]|nr:beta-lactamase family protein [Chitinophagaceae bacterium]